MLVASAGRICVRRGSRVRPTASNCGGGGGGIGRGLRRGGDQVTTRIDPLDRYILRSMRAGCAACIADGGRRADAVSDRCEKRPPTRKLARAARCGRDEGSARVALSNHHMHISIQMEEENIASKVTQ
jgi:hypothetical protein